MKWQVDFSKDAEKFIQKQNIRTKIREEIRRLLIKIPLIIEKVDFRGNIYK